MPFIVVHEDDCKIAVEGPTQAKRVAASAFVHIATPCSCGGYKVQVSLRLPADSYSVPLVMEGSASPFPRCE